MLIASLSGLAVIAIRRQQEKTSSEQLAQTASGITDSSDIAKNDALTKNIASSTDEDVIEASGDNSNATATDENTYVSPIDWEALWKENEDIYAWIWIADTVIDYPVLQSDPDDPDYYLMRNVDGSSGYPGSLFTESDLNESPFEDYVTIIYGHNMKNGTMFGSLKKWEDEIYRDEHRTFAINTLDQEREYTFAFVQRYDNRNILYNFNCNNETGYSLFLDSLENTRMIPYWHADDIDLNTKEKIVILSTCSGNDRLLVGGVLTEDGEPVKFTSEDE